VLVVVAVMNRNVPPYLEAAGDTGELAVGLVGAVVDIGVEVLVAEGIAVGVAVGVETVVACWAVDVGAEDGVGLAVPLQPLVTKITANRITRGTSSLRI
jgi:hypothetical protein